MPSSWRTTSASSAPGSGPDPSESDWTAADRAALLEVARAAVRAAAGGMPSPALPEDLRPRLRVPAGAFVSLHRGGELRGCIGSVTPEGSLAALVARMASAAATRDPRFPPLDSEELRGLRVEISVLSPARAVPPEEIDPAAHGVSVRLGHRRAVFLPQVAARHGWDRTTLLARLCEKADLPPRAWHDPAAVLLVFTVEIVEGEV